MQFFEGSCLSLLYLTCSFLIGYMELRYSLRYYVLSILISSIISGCIGGGTRGQFPHEICKCWEFSFLQQKCAFVSPQLLASLATPEWVVANCGVVFCTDVVIFSAEIIIPLINYLFRVITFK